MKGYSKKLFGIIIALLLVLSLVMACAKATPTPTPQPTTSAPATSTAPTTSTPAPTTSKPATTTPATTTSTSTPATTATQSAADFFKGKTVTMIVPYAVGGGTDYAARVFASVWSDFVPGGAMIVKNVPGAGGITGANQVYTAKADGLTMGETETGSGLLAPQLFGDPAMKYDATKFAYLGEFAPSPPFFLVGKNSKITKPEELQGLDGFKFGGTSPISDNGIASVVVAEMFKMTNPKLVTGYGGTAELSLALGRGEIDGAQGAATVVNDWTGKGMAKTPLFIIDYQRSDWFKDIPAVTEFITPTAAQKTYLNMLLVMASRKAVFLPPGVPQDRIDYLRDIYNKIVNDAGVIKLMQKQWPVWDKPMTGQEWTKMVNEVLAIPEADKSDMKAKIDAMNKLK